MRLLFAALRRQKTIRKCHGAGMVRDENVDSDGMVVKSLELHIYKETLEC